MENTGPSPLQGGEEVGSKAQASSGTVHCSEQEDALTFSQLPLEKVMPCDDTGYIHSHTAADCIVPSGHEEHSFIHSFTLLSLASIVCQALS